MKKFRIAYYDIDGYVDEDIVECNDLECAEDLANKTLEKKIERAEENYETFLLPSYYIEEITVMKHPLKINNKIKDVLFNKQITQKELSQMTGIRESTISEIVRGTKTGINFEHISKIATALNITDISELFEIVEA